MRVEHNIPQIQATLRSLRNDLEKKAAVRALNRAADMSKTEAKREMTKKYSFKSSEVGNTLTVYKATPARVEATVRSKGRRTPLLKMMARQTKKGVTVKIGKTRKLIPSAFIATMKSGHRGVFIRLTKKNLPIKELYTISIPEGFGSQDVMDAVKLKMGDAFYKRFEHELRRMLEAKQK